MPVQLIDGPPVPGNNQGCQSNLPEDHFLVKSNRIATWNVRGLNEDYKLTNLLKEMKRLKMNILGVSETHWTTEVPDNFVDSKYVIIHSGNKQNIKRKGVAFIIDEETSKCVRDFELISDRMMSITLNTQRGPLTIFQVYAPDSSYDDEVYYNFFDILENNMNRLPLNHSFMVLGDFNARVGQNPNNIWPNNAGKFGYGDLNDRGTYLLQFCATHNLVITNTLFKHNLNRRPTWIHPDGIHRGQIDFIIVPQKLKRFVKNSRVYNSASVGSDHSLLLSIFETQAIRKKYRPKRAPRKFNVERLISDPERARLYETRIGGRFEPLLNLNDVEIEIENFYSQFKLITNDTTKDIVGYRARKPVDGMSPELELLCEKRRSLRLKALNNPNDPTVRDEYRQTNREVKTKVKACKVENLQKKVFELEADFRNSNSHNLFKTVRDLESKPPKSLTVIKDKQGNLKTQLEEVLSCWEEHFKAHLNKSFPREDNAIETIPEPPINDEPTPDISLDEVRKAIKRCKFRKAPGIDQITAEAIRYGGDTMAQVLHKMIKHIWSNECTPSDWSKMLVSPIHKKGDRLNPANYRAVSLLSIPGKIFSQILLDRIKTKTESFIKESQFGFRPDRGTVDAIFITRQIIEKAREHNMELHLNFIDFKSAFDTIWRAALWKMLRSIGIDEKIVKIIENLYEDTQCAVVIEGNLTEWFTVEVGVRQGCLLSPTLFNIFLDFVMEDLKSIQTNLSLSQDLSCDIRYADDTTLIATILAKLELSTAELERSCAKWGMLINSGKTKVISPNQIDITINNEKIDKVDSFVYLGSTIPNSSDDVLRRTALAAQAFGRLKNVVWKNRNISLPLKVRLYNALIVPIATYASETWTLIEKDKRILNTFEMRCLRCMLGVSLLNRIRNDEIRRRLGVKIPIVELVKQKRLRWFGHVVRRHRSGYVHRAYSQDFTKKRLPGRPKKRWRDQIREDLNLPIQTSERVAKDRDAWKRLTAGNNGARILRGLRN